MKDQLSVVIAAVALSYAAVRIYQKYIKKDKPGGGTAPKGNKTFMSSSRDDDYEPYSKKQ